MLLNLFDFDGTLVDTDEQLLHAYQQAFWEEAKVTLTADVWHDHKGKPLADVCVRFGLSEEQRHRIAAHKAGIYPFAYNFDINTDLLDIAKRSDSLNYICTATSTSVVAEILLKCNIAPHLFTDILSTKNHGCPKPSPGIYLIAFFHAMKLRHIDSVHVYEDSAVGLLAAERFADVVGDAFPKIEVTVHEIDKYWR